MKSYKIDNIIQILEEHQCGSLREHDDFTNYDQYYYILLVSMHSNDQCECLGTIV